MTKILAAAELQAAARTNGLSLTGAVSIRAADGSAGAPRIPTVDMVLYTGDSIRQYWSDYPMVIDLKGFECGQRVAINYVHDTYSPDNLLGQTTSVENDGKQIALQGQLLNTESEITQHVVRMASKGFQWQASVGGDALSYERAAQIFDFVAQNGWDEKICGGGVTWCPPPTSPYKNAITVELFISSAMALAPYEALAGKPAGGTTNHDLI